MKSITKNGIFYLFYNIVNMVFPFLTSIYVANVLSPNAIGEVDYAQNIVTYFSTIAFLGIPTYGVREISKNRDDVEKLNILYSELFVINFISTVFFSVAYFFALITVPLYRDNIEIYIILGMIVVLNMANVSWLFEGLEEFKFISLRNAFTKIIIYIILVFFVKDEGDIYMYAVIIVLGIAANNVVNLLYSRSFVRLKLKKININRHLKSIFLLVIVNLAIEIYTLVDITMLGMFSTYDRVAYYTCASRINKVLLQITNSISMVLVPRLSFYYEKKYIDKFSEMLARARNIIIIVSIPMIIGIQFTAEYIICKLYGNNYINAAYVERILCFNILITPIGYLLGSRVLLIAKKELDMVVCVCCGAVTNIIFNYFLINRYNEFGASIASVISEMVVCAMYLYKSKNEYKLKSCCGTIIKVAVTSFIMICYLFICELIIGNLLVQMIIQIVGSVIIYGTLLYILKEYEIRSFVNNYLLKSIK